MTPRRSPRRTLAIISHLVPPEQRAGWLREWDAEFCFYLHPNAPGVAGRGRWWTWSRLSAAVQHAWCLRWVLTGELVPPSETSRARALTDLGGDVRYAIRGWRRSPGFSATVVCTLALGLGLAAAIFSFADGYLFRPLPFPGGDRTYFVSDPHAAIASALKASDVVALRRSAVAEFGFVEWSLSHTSGNLAVDGRQIAARAYEVSEGFRRTLALPLLAGRDFTAGDHASGAPLVAWLSDRFWQSAFGGDRSVIDRVYRLEGARGSQSLRIVGILGPEVSSFDLNNSPPDVVLPAQDAVQVGPNQLAFPLVLIPGHLSRTQAIDRISAALQAVAPAADGRPRVVGLEPLQDAQTAGGRPTARVFFAGALLVLLLASINLLHLQLGRGVARAREVATRAALGASRWRVVRLFLVESLALGFVGIVAGLVLGKNLSGLIAAKVPQLPSGARNLSLVPMIFDARVVAFTVVLGLIVVIVGGCWPAWRVLRGSMPGPGKSLAATGRPLSHRFARVILTSELTVATVVVIGAVFLGSGIYRYLHQPLGFSYDERARIDLSSADGGRLAGAVAADIARAVRDVPGVAAATLDVAPLRDRQVDVPGSSVDLKNVAVYGVSTGYLQTWGMGLQSGRWFEDAEFAGGADAAVVDARFARAAWPGAGAGAVGQTVRAGGSLRHVIGVVESRHDRLDRESPPVIYVPQAESASRPDLMVWVPGAAADALRERVTRAVETAAPGTHVGVTPLTFESLFARSIGEAVFQTPVVIAFGVLALTLAGVGVFGLVLYLVEQRRREFGIRMALGAQRVDVWRTVIRESLQPAAIGLAAGSLGAWALESVVRSSVFGWPASGWLSLAIVAVGLFVVATAAALIPAARATRIDPAVTLKAE